jgi:hypothetical protein
VLATERELLIRGSFERGDVRDPTLHEAIDNPSDVRHS